MPSIRGSGPSCSAAVATVMFFLLLSRSNVSIASVGCSTPRAVSHSTKFMSHFVVSLGSLASTKLYSSDSFEKLGEARREPHRQLVFRLPGHMSIRHHQY